MTVAMPGACLTRREPILSDILVLKILATGTPHISICLSNVFLMFSQTRTGTKTCAVYDIAAGESRRVRSKSCTQQLIFVPVLTPQRNSTQSRNATI